MYPLARTEKLTVRELPHETVAYDLENNKVHCLSPKSALVWKHCDGRTSLEELAKLVWDHESCEFPEALVQLALEQLERRNLLVPQTRSSPDPTRSRSSRRSALRKMAALAVSIPVIMSLSAPRAQAGDSIFGGQCTDASDCLPRFCNTVTCKKTPGVPNICQYIADPNLNGTSCGLGMQCNGGNCVPIPTS